MTTSLAASLVQITETTHPLYIEMRYATTNNFTQQIIYPTDECWIHQDVLPLLENAIKRADQQNLKLKIFDAWRPQSAQKTLWSVFPDARFVMPPEKGSAHTRGVAVDLTLTTPTGEELCMGTPFDDFTIRSFHNAKDLNAISARNRYMLLGIMVSAGWDFFINEWWHYQAFQAKEYPLILER